MGRRARYFDARHLALPAYIFCAGRCFNANKYGYSFAAQMAILAIMVFIMQAVQIKCWQNK
jgi:hypothetical protein